MMKFARSAVIKACFFMTGMMQNVALPVTHGLKMPAMIKIVRFVLTVLLSHGVHFILKIK